MSDELSTYAIQWRTSFNSIEEFEQCWSTLMENEVDCLVFSGSANRNYATGFTIYFKTIKSRDTAKNLRALLK